MQNLLAISISKYEEIVIFKKFLDKTFYFQISIGSSAFEEIILKRSCIHVILFLH